MFTTRRFLPALVFAVTTGVGCGGTQTPVVATTQASPTCPPSSEHQVAALLPALDVPACRENAAVSLRASFDELGNNPSPSDEASRAWLDAALPTVVTTFEHGASDRVHTEFEHIVLAARDPRTLPALRAIIASDAVNESTLAALHAIDELAASIPDDEKDAWTQALTGVLAHATAMDDEGRDARYRAIVALGVLHTPASSDAVDAAFQTALHGQDWPTAAIAVRTLFAMDHEHAIPAIVIASLAPDEGVRMAAIETMPQVPRAALVTEFVRAIHGENPTANDMLGEGVAPTAAQHLGALAAPEAMDPLAAIIGSPATKDDTRMAAAMALVRIAVANPARRAAVVTAFTSAWGAENAPPTDGSHQFIPFVLGTSVAMLGDPAFIARIQTTIQNRAIQAVNFTDERIMLLGSMAMLARARDARALPRTAASLRAEVQDVVRRQPAAEPHTRPLFEALDAINGVIAVATECHDGDLACYQGKLQNQPEMVTIKAALMLAWTSPANRRTDARTAIMPLLTSESVRVRGVARMALELLAPDGCPECAEAVSNGVASAGLDEREDAQLLAARLRSHDAH